MSHLPFVIYSSDEGASTGEKQGLVVKEEGSAVSSALGQSNPVVFAKMKHVLLPFFKRYDVNGDKKMDIEEMQMLMRDLREVWLAICCCRRGHQDSLWSRNRLLYSCHIFSRSSLSVS
jgi:hypothetical protein